MPPIQKCETCRGLKQRCEPLDRIWIPGEPQSRCQRCIKSNRECGPHQFPPVKAPNDQQREAEGSVTSLPVARQVVSGSQADRGLEMEDIKELKARLLNMEIHLDITQHQISAIRYIEEYSQHHLMDCHEIVASKDANLRVLSLTRVQAETLAMKVGSYGQTREAANAYTRILAAYLAQDVMGPQPWHEIRGLRWKLANSHWSLGEPLQAEQFAWKALETQVQPAMAQPSDANILILLGRSMSQNWEERKGTIQRLMTGFSANFWQLPPLQSMMQKSYARNVANTLFHCGPFAEECFAGDVPIVGGLGAILKFLDVFCTADLVATDMWRRTPLFLAVFLQMEGLARGILSQIPKHPTLSQQRLVNARDSRGQTVLAAAVQACCSMRLLSLLIELGAEVNPQAMMPPTTPLEVAVRTQRADVCSLLLKHGANVHHTYPGYLTPLQIARYWTNYPEDSPQEQIVRILEAAVDDQGEGLADPRLFPP